ncbi:hypothetical protein HYS92_01220 [Candidatus Daviesbacteria bacterium]|nr:hypothetical protein [Candidatus Daviesbacteria bacterium]
MSDSGGGVKQFAGEMKGAVAEVTKDAKDSVGEAIEQGVQSVVGTQPTPQQVQQKQQEDQKRELDRQKQLVYTRGWLKNLEAEQQKVRKENKQKEQRRLQTEQQEKQTTEMKKEEKKKQPVNPAVAYAGKVEFKRGVGG